MAMKYLFGPLLVAGMFVSFTAALVATLFYTEKITSPADLMALVTGDVDSLSSDLITREDEMSRLATMIEAYLSEYESRLDSLAFERDSLASVTADVVNMRAALDAEVDRLGLLADSTGLALRRQRIALLVPAFNKIKAAAAAQIFAEGTMVDTTVAMMMLKLQPRQTARILSNMEVALAARVTSQMQEVAQP